MALNGSDIRARFNKKFMHLSKKNSRAEATLILLVEMTAIASCVLVPLLILQHSWLAFVAVYWIAIAMIGMRMRCFGNIIHECSHGGFVNDRAWNEAIGRLLSILLLYSFANYRRDHITHHQYTGDYERDREFADTAKFNFHEPLTSSRWLHYLRRFFVAETILAYTGRTFLGSNESLPWKIARLIYVGSLLAAVGGLVVLNPVAIIVVAFWIVPLCVVLPAIGYATDIMDHAGLLQNEDDIDKARNYVVESAFIQWLIFPRNDSYHLFHHLFPAVSTRSFPECHAILMSECPEYAARKHSLAEWVEDFRYRNPAPSIS
ncbi:fatty acid desaturase family protein [Mesorhizobium sp. UC22_110]